MALSIDESSSEDNLTAKTDAIPHYQAGIQSLQAGISLPLPRDSTCPHLTRAHVLRDKMRANLSTAQERLTFLTTSLHLNNLSLAAVASENLHKNSNNRKPKPVANNKPPMVRSNTFTKEDNNSKLKFRCDNSNSTKMASSPVSSPTRPRINRAAELRLKNNNNGSGSKSRSGSINSIAPSSSSTVRKSAERENLRKSCQVIKGCDSKLVEMILNEVIPRGSTGVTWADVSGRGLYYIILIRRT